DCHSVEIELCKCRRRASTSTASPSQSTSLLGDQVGYRAAHIREMLLCRDINSGCSTACHTRHDLLKLSFHPALAVLAARSACLIRLGKSVRQGSTCRDDNLSAPLTTAAADCWADVKLAGV